MEGIRKEIIKELLHKIEVNMDTLALEDSVAVFSEFIKALTLEASLRNPDAENDELAKQQTEAANAYANELAILFQSSGDQSEALKKLSSKIKKAGLKLDTI